MPRLAILSADEIKAFDKPPRLTAAQREKYFHLSDKLLVLKNKLTSDTSKLAIVLQWGYFGSSRLCVDSSESNYARCKSNHTCSIHN
jgi:hypothetical protein